MTNRRLLAVLGIVILVALGYFGYARRAAQPAASLPEEEETGPAVIWASGNVVPVEQATLAFPIGGRIAAIEVAEGDSVTRGTVLLRLDGHRPSRPGRAGGTCTGPCRGATRPTPRRPAAGRDRRCERACRFCHRRGRTS